MPRDAPQIRRLDDLLDRQQNFVLTGQLGALAALLPQLERAVDQVRTIPQNSQTHAIALHRIKARAARQANLMRSVLRGLADASTVISPRPGGVFSAYDSNGKATRLDQTRPSIEQRG